MKTKDRILDAARELFNVWGVAHVSVRQICEQLSISPGNFSYHYPHKDQLVVELYTRMQQELAEVLTSVMEQAAGVRVFLESHRHLFRIQRKYKFVYLNLFEILSRHPEVLHIYREASSLERQAAKQLLIRYIEEGVIVPDINPLHFERVVLAGQILNMAWAVDAEIHFEGQAEEQMRHYLNICCGMIEPYLSESARREYEAFFEELDRG